jgi:hypothetical protein
MAGLLEYIAWRGDLPLSVAPFNNIDALVLCQISYLDFDGLLTAGFTDRIPLKLLAERFRGASDYERRCDTGVLINNLTVQLLLDAGASRRFGTMPACGYVNRVDLSREEQFAAVTYLTGDKHVFVAYRGTDDTIIGWKEDFNLGILETVPAQVDALSYLESACAAIHGKFRIGGHSKGGNLAVYAGAMVAGKYRKRITCVYNNDGPGFRDKTIQKPEFQAIIPKIRSFYPQFSIVGMLFSHAGTYTVVESDQSGIMQHDPFSWHIMGNSFVALDDFDAKSIRFDKTFNTWLIQLVPEQRAKFVETLFSVIQVTDARTNTELGKNWLHNSAKIVYALISLDQETRNAVLKTMQLLFKIAKQNLPELKELSVTSK